MKIGVVGCGAVGSFYGARLALSGQCEVHFLLRSDYDVVNREGVLIRDREGEYRAFPKCARSAEEIGRCDLVLIALKTTANHEFSRLLSPLAGTSTTVLTLQNGLGNEEELASLFSPQQILGGLCFVCLNRVAPGVILHLDHGLIVMGEFSGPLTDRTLAVARLFESSGVACKVTSQLAKAHWEKLVWNIPFNGLGVAGAAGLEAVKTGSYSRDAHLGQCLTTRAILAQPEWARLARELMLEVIATARASGFDVPLALADKQLERTATMGDYKASTLLDFELGRPLELESLFLRPLRQSETAGVNAPRLQSLCALLQKMERDRQTPATPVHAASSSVSRNP